MSDERVRVAVTGGPPPRRWSLRVRAGDVAAVGAALGLPLPTRIGAVARSGACRALCLGPDEWEVETDDGVLPSLPAEVPHALVDVSDRDVSFRLVGPSAIDLLAMAIARDIAQLRPGEGCRTVFDSVPVVLVREEDGAFTMRVWRSFASHMLARLETGREELGSGL